MSADGIAARSPLKTPFGYADCYSGKPYPILLYGSLAGLPIAAALTAAEKLIEDHSHRE